MIQNVLYNKYHLYKLLNSFVSFFKYMTVKYWKANETLAPIIRYLVRGGNIVELNKNQLIIFFFLINTYRK